MPYDRDPLVSVILPTFNRSSYLRQALDSVLNQTFEDFEVLVVDDGSTDNTARVVRAIDDPRVRYVYQQNAGRSAARNRGLENARGDLIAFLDDDDEYLPHKLACQVRYLENRPAIDLVASGTQVIDANGTPRTILRGWQDQPSLTLLACLDACPLPTCTVLLRRRALDRLDYWFDVKMDLAEDTDLFIRMLLVGCRMAWLPRVVSARRLPTRRHNGQLDGSGYGRAYVRLLDKLFGRRDVPEQLLARRKRLYARYYLTGACHAYADHHVEVGQTYLLRALDLCPDLARGNVPMVVSHVAAFAGTVWITEPHAYIKFMFDHLPGEVSSLAQYRNMGLSAFHMGRLFKAHEAGGPLSLSDWLLGVYYAPRWLCNRGVWSILARGLADAIPWCRAYRQALGHTPTEDQDTADLCPR